MNKLELYYNKFNEDKRLLSRHGQVEFFVTTKYIEKFIGDRKNLKILDIGAGTGRYSIYFSEMGHEVTALELVKKNLSQIKKKSDKVVAIQGNALKLKFDDNSFDITLVFGPLYHLMSYEEKLQAILEAKRVTKPGGYIFLMYLLADYAIISYAFKEGNLLECIKNNKLDSNFDVKTTEDDLYSYVRMEIIDKLKQQSDLNREKIIAVDGPTDYIRPVINKMNEEEFEIYKEYQLFSCERPELLGASSHILDILKK